MRPEQAVDIMETPSAPPRRMGIPWQGLLVSAELPKPFISSTNYSPVEGEDSVALMCEPETQDITYLWWINGHSLPDSDRLELSKDNRTQKANFCLSCHASSNPAAQYSWLFNGRPQSSTHELIIPNITANNGASYTCHWPQ
uniref:Carcinoembryonic antigen-related cell adhesion molecule 6-like n=1 Tax=Castor canadensis TaxID=51338 RepID=A0A8B7UTH3_CASCN|nr:carcinoembryonic antigen-related cell adhesion molecule 6-like [Castor canadensis]